MTNKKGYMETLFYKDNLFSYVRISCTNAWNNVYYNLADNLLNWSVPYESRYFSTPSNNPYIIYEFLKDIPYFSYYYILTHDDVKGKSHPVEWTVEGANSYEDQWEFLDKRNDTKLIGFNRKELFLMKKTNYRLIKFTQQKNYYDTEEYRNTFAVKKIDFYSSFIPKLTIDCNDNYIRISPLLYLIIQLK